MEKKELMRVIEALLMASSRPLSPNEMGKVIGDGQKPVPRKVLLEALAELARECEGKAYELVEVASGYRYQTRAEFSDWLAKLWEQKPARYSRAALETLALIVYRQPVTRAVIEDIRGVAVSTNIIRGFEDRGWIEVVGHKEVPGRPALYATTRAFLDDFNLRSLDELPELPQLRSASEVMAANAEEPLPTEGSAPPSEESAPPTEESAPPSEESAPPPEGSAPPSEESAPPPEESAPPTEESAPPSEESAPPSEESAPPSEESAPPSEESAPPPEESAPPPEESAPPTEESAPPTEESAPPTEESAPPTEESAPPPEESAPPTEESAPPPLAS